MTATLIKLSASGQRRTLRFTGPDAHTESLAMSKEYLSASQWKAVLSYLASAPRFRSVHYNLAFAGVGAFRCAP